MIISYKKIFKTFILINDYNNSHVEIDLKNNTIKQYYKKLKYVKIFFNNELKNKIKHIKDYDHEFNNSKHIEYYNFSKTIKIYRKNYLHSTDGPALIEVQQNSKIKEYYYQYGKLHNMNGPAYIKYNKNGDIILKRYFFNGICHNDVDYADFYHNNKEYYIYGNLVNDNYFKKLKNNKMFILKNKLIYFKYKLFNMFKYDIKYHILELMNKLK